MQSSSHASMFVLLGVAVAVDTGLPFAQACLADNWELWLYCMHADVTVLAASFF